jgi:hypothetical protein
MTLSAFLATWDIIKGSHILRSPRDPMVFANLEDQVWA